MSRALQKGRIITKKQSRKDKNHNSGINQTNRFQKAQKMSYTRAQVDSILSLITENFNLKIGDVQDAVKDIYKPPSAFASKSAADKAKENDIDPTKLNKSSKDGRITLQDVNDFLGISEKKDSKPKDFVSKTAWEEAKKNDLEAKDFSAKERSGVDRKTKKKTKITLEDVRNKANKKSSPFASATAKKFAEENDVDPEDVTGTGRDGKIRKSDIQDFLNEQAAEEEENENEDSEEEENEEEENEEEDNESEEELGEESEDEEIGEESEEEELGEESE